MVEEYQVTVQRTARYYQLGTLTPQTKNIWFVLHGYGQLARYFIRRFDVLADAETLIVAPEALSRLYTDAEFGKVGASWLTREARDSEIADYVTYLDQVWATVLGEYNPKTLTINLMGFSQGASTVCRWLELGNLPHANRLLLWAGFFANGLADILTKETVANIPVAYVYGTEDEYISQLPDPDTYLNRLQSDIPTLRIIPFSGKHVVDREVLLSVVKG